MGEASRLLAGSAVTSVVPARPASGSGSLGPLLGQALLERHRSEVVAQASVARAVVVEPWPDAFVVAGELAGVPDALRFAGPLPGSGVSQMAPPSVSELRMPDPLPMSLMSAVPTMQLPAPPMPPPHSLSSPGLPGIVVAPGGGDAVAPGALEQAASDAGSGGAAVLDEGGCLQRSALGLASLHLTWILCGPGGARI